MFTRRRRTSLLLCLVVLVVFVSGVAAGMLAVSSQGGGEQELGRHLERFLDDFREDPQYDRLFAFRNSVLSNVRMLGLMWVMGLIVVGLPVVLAVLFFRGLALGFTLAFLIEKMAFRGLLFAVVSVLPHNALLVPAYLLTGVGAMRFCLLVFRRHRLRSTPLGDNFFRYTVLVLASCLLVFLGAAVEAYVSPHLISLYVRYLS